MSDDGWTKSYRSKWTHPVFRTLTHAGIWAWMTDSAAWRDTSVRYCDHVVALKRGQLVASERFIADGFGVTRIVIRNLLDALERAQMIARERAQGTTIITICNYAKYQSQEDGESPDESPPESPGQAQAKPRPSPNKEELKNLRTKESKSAQQAGFVEWYGAYPRKVAKGGALKAYQRAITKTTHEILLAATKRFASECAGKDQQYIAYPASWLNDERWGDEPLRTAANGSTPQKKSLGPAAGTPEFDAQRREAGI